MSETSEAEGEARLQYLLDLERERVRMLEKEVKHLRDQLASTTWRASLPHASYNKEVGSE